MARSIIGRDFVAKVVSLIPILLILNGREMVDAVGIEPTTS